MKKVFLLGTMLIMTFLIGCTSQNNIDTGELDNYDVSKTSDEVTDGDFVYRLVTERGQYQEDEPVKVYAELEYIGEKDEITIFHAASPFYFPIKEKVRNYDLGYAMNEPLISTTLKQGKPLRKEYMKSGGYSDQGEDNYVAFMKKFFNMDGFPIGYYVVDGFADFYIETGENDEEKEDFRIEGQIDFKVIE
jgi:hypothetical protein